MSNFVAWIKDVDVICPFFSHEYSFEEALFNAKKNERHESIKVEMEKALKPYFKICRRMNRTAKMGFLSAVNVLNKSQMTDGDFDHDRFGTMISTTNASYDSVYRILDKLYSEGVESVSPIDFTFSVGNSLLSGITINYKLLGPSNVVPSSEALPLAMAILENDEADHMLVSSVNIVTDENLNYYDQFDFIKDDAGLLIKEQAVSIILEKEDSKSHDVSCYIKNTAQIHKSRLKSNIPKKCDSEYDIDTNVELSEFDEEDFKKAVIKAANGEMCDVALLCSFGSGQMRDAENKAVKDIMSNAKTYVLSDVFGMNLGSSFMLNVAAAVEILRNQKLPYGEKSEKPIKNIFVNGFDDIGNIISGVVSCN